MEQLEFVTSIAVYWGWHCCSLGAQATHGKGRCLTLGPWVSLFYHVLQIGHLSIWKASFLCSVKGFVWPYIHSRLWHEAVSTLTKRSGHMASVCKPSSSAKLTCSVSQQRPQRFLSTVGTSSGLLLPRKPCVPSAWTTGWSRDSLLLTPERTLRTRIFHGCAGSACCPCPSMVSHALDTRFQRKGSALRSGQTQGWQY